MTTEASGDRGPDCDPLVERSGADVDCLTPRVDYSHRIVQLALTHNWVDDQPRDEADGRLDGAAAGLAESPHGDRHQLASPAPNATKHAPVVACFTHGQQLVPLGFLNDPGRTTQVAITAGSARPNGRLTDHG